MVAHLWISTLFAIGVGVQFFLAGLGLFEGRTSDLAGSHKIVETSTMDAHRALGSLLVLVALLVFLAALAAGYRGRILGMSGVLLLIVVVQMFLAGLGTDTAAVFGGLHVVNAVVIVFLTARIMEEARRALRGASSTQPAAATSA